MSIEQLSIGPLRRWVLTLAFGFFLSITGIAIYTAEIDKSNSLRTAEIAVQTNAQNLAEHAARSFDAADLLLKLTIARYKTLLQYATIDHNKFRKDFLELLKTVPQVGAIVLINKQGRVVTASLSTAINLNVKDRNYFNVYTERDDIGFYLGNPIVSRVSGRWLYPASKPIYDREGTFVGAAAGFITQDYFSGVYTASEEESGIASAFVSISGHIFAVSQNFSDLDENLGGREIDFLSRSDGDLYEGNFTGRLFNNEAQRIVSFHKVDGIPAYVVSTMTEAQALEGWWQRTKNLIFLVLGIYVVLILITVFALRLLTRFQLSEESRHESDTRFRNLFDKANDAIIVVDHDTMILADANQSACNLFGYSHDILTKHKLSHLRPEGSNVSVDSVIEGIRAKGSKICEAVYIRKGGQVFNVEVSSNFVEFSGKTYVISILRDIDVRKKEELQLRKAMMETELASKSKSDFLANMSHELRTPLNAIIGFSEFLKEGFFGALNSKNQEYAVDIHGAGTHLLDLISDILDVSLIESGQVKIEKTAVDLEKVFDVCRTIVSARASKANINVQFELEETLPPIAVDPIRLKQILINLIDNSIKYTPRGGLVTVSGQIQNDNLLLSVEDNGVGIAGDDMDKIFETFGQIRESSTHQHAGLGLGLPLSRSLVELLGGTLGIESQEGTGTTVRISFPAI